MTKIAVFFNRLEEMTLVLVLLGLALVSFVQVICRYFIGFSFTWMEELTRYTGVFIAFLGASIGVKYGTHFSMVFLYERLKSDRVRQGLLFGVNIICCTVLLILAWYGWEQAMKLRKFGTLTAVLRIPKYLVYLPIAFFSLMMATRFLWQAWRQFRDFLAGSPFKTYTGTEA
jgi:C4-dicarboxylate transporter DctQ subunit